MEIVAKSKMKAHCLEYFRQVENTGQELVITDRGKPVLKLVPYRNDPAEMLAGLRNTVVRFDDPTEPVAEEDWEALR